MHDGALDGGVARPADPDRRVRLLNGRRRGRYFLERCELAFERRNALAPQHLHSGQVLVCHGATLVERKAKRLKLQRRPAGADAEYEAAAAEPVQAGDHAGGEHRVPVRQDDDGRAECDLLRLPGQPGQRRERVVQGRGIASADVPGHGDVIARHRQVVAEALGERRPARQRLRRRRGPKVQQVDSSLHLRLPEGASAPDGGAHHDNPPFPEALEGRADTKPPVSGWAARPDTCGLFLFEEETDLGVSLDHRIETGQEFLSALM